MRETREADFTRRALLSGVGAGLATIVSGTTLAARQDSEPEYVLVQGDQCVPIEPLRGEEPGAAFYDYHLPEKHVDDANGGSVGDDAKYASAGTTDLQRAQTSIAFLYRGPERLSLVVVHGSVEASDSGSVTFEFAGLPDAGDWTVKDDRYGDLDSGDVASSNYDRWDVEGTNHSIDWTWGSAGTDGGVFAGLGDEFDVTIHPAFNEEAALYDQHYEGPVTDWQFLSGDADDPERISLDMSEPIRISTGDCESDMLSDSGDQRSNGQEQESSEEEGEGADEEEGEEADEEDTEAAYAVCHEPPGNPDNARTIRVGSESALEAHLAHGDLEGPCAGDGSGSRGG